MKTSIPLRHAYALLLALATQKACISAQPAPGFPVESSTATLEIKYENNVVDPAGELMPRSDLLMAPQITIPNTTLPSDTLAVLLMVDSDVPRNGTRVELLHWLSTNITLSPSDSSPSSLTLIFPPSSPAEYRPPNPPVGDTPHAYTFIVFAQPEGFSIPQEFNDVLESRVFFNSSAFVAAAGLPTPALAANYLRVQNLTGTPTTTFPPPRPTGNETGEGSAGGNGDGNGTQELFPGMAAPGAGLGSEMMFWVGLVTAAVVGVGAFGL